MFPTYDPQSGGGNIQVGTGVAPQPSQTYQVQPATNVLNTSPVYNAPSYTTDTSSGGGTTTAPYVDPYAAYGGTAAYNNLVSGFADQKTNIYGTANDAAATAGVGLNGSILDFVASLKSGQGKIDNAAIDAELAKRMGTAGVLGMVSRGVRSGGVMLANKNAGNSSASEAIGRAYGDIGRRELGGVGSQYAQAERQIGLSQADLEAGRASGSRKITDSKTTVINSIVADARDKLAQLDAQMLSANMPDRINIEQEKEAIRQQVLADLQSYDEQLAAGASSVSPMGADAIGSEVNKLASAGTAPTNAFSFTDQVPAEFQNTGPFSSELPLFTLPRKRTA